MENNINYMDKLIKNTLDKNTNERNFEFIKKDYDENRIKFGVELSSARKFLLDNGDITTIIWGCSFTITMIAIFLVSIYSLGLLGIIYALIFDIIFMSYMGICSIQTNAKRVGYIISILGLIISFFLEWNLTVLLVFSFGSFVSVYLFYNYVLHRITEIALKDIDTFTYLINFNIIKLFYK